MVCPLFSRGLSPILPYSPLMRLGRSLPELPADLLFEADEWKAAFVLNKKPPPKQVP